MGAPIGNQNASKQWRKSLEKALARLGGSDIDSGLAMIADKVVSAAVAGDKDAWKDIADRLDGRPAQSVTLAGDEDNPVRTISRIELVPLRADSKS